MKIGILTFHSMCNYGAVLQCLCLKRAVEKCGCEVEVIDFTAKRLLPPPIWRAWGIGRPGGVRNALNRAIGVIHGPVTMKTFSRFRQKHLALSPLCPDEVAVGNLANKYDAIIAGSDQVWNQGHNRVYFLDWDKPYRGRRISYSACFGQCDQPEHVRQNAGDWLRRFSSISVRNGFSQTLVKELCGRDAAIVADPTVLEDLSAIAQPPKLPHPEYILTYTLHREGREAGHTRIVQLLKKAHSEIPVVSVVLSVTCPHTAQWADQVFWSASPEEWLHLMANARFIYTDSFHGAIFAMKLKRPFLVRIPEGWRAPRLHDLANRYGIQDRLISGPEEVSTRKLWEKPLDHGAITSRMDAHAGESFDWLKSALMKSAD